MAPSPILICFAVKEEAQAFQEILPRRSRARVLITGMGKTNAEKAITEALQKIQPVRVVSSGFAGGLNPQITSGTVVFEGADLETETALLRLNALSIRFHCADRVATTVAEKCQVRKTTGADAVEMESLIIGDVCRKAGIPFTTVRVILDAADEDLPLDFNRLMTAKQKLSGLKLAGALLKAPGKIGELKRFQKRCQAAARTLATALVRIIPA